MFIKPSHAEERYAFIVLYHWLRLSFVEVQASSYSLHLLVTFQTLPLCPSAVLREEILSPSLKHLSQDERVGLLSHAEGKVRQNLIKMDLRSRLMSNKGTSGGFSAQREHLQPWNQVKRHFSAIEFVASAASSPSETKSRAQTIRSNNGPHENNHALIFLTTQQSISFEGFVILKSVVSSKLNLKQIVPWHPNGYTSLFILCLTASALGMKISFFYCLFFVFFLPLETEKPCWQHCREIKQRVFRKITFISMLFTKLIIKHQSITTTEQKENQLFLVLNKLETDCYVCTLQRRREILELTWKIRTSRVLITHLKKVFERHLFWIIGFLLLI